jgi:hypothetical protein
LRSYRFENTEIPIPNEAGFLFPSLGAPFFAENFAAERPQAAHKQFFVAYKPKGSGMANKRWLWQQGFVWVHRRAAQPFQLWDKWRG